MSVRIILVLAFMIAILSGCTYNPFVGDNHTTGNIGVGALGAGAGAATVAAAGGTKPFIAVGGIAGGMFGYYMTTLRHDSAGIIKGGGKVYKVGEAVGIYIPSDKLFEPNTANLLPSAEPILDSVATVLARYPSNNIIISGNTNGVYRARWERRLSERRAKAVSAYLWKAGINNYKGSHENNTVPTNDFRRLNYIGYGDYFPIATNFRNSGIRANSRIQITSYPSDCDLKLDQHSKTLRTIGSMGDDEYIPVNLCPNNASMDEATGECIVQDV